MFHLYALVSRCLLNVFYVVLLTAERSRERVRRKVVEVAVSQVKAGGFDHRIAFYLKDGTPPNTAEFNLIDTAKSCYPLWLWSAGGTEISTAIRSRVLEIYA